jgi:glycosyltransferase involved in cell wall biosynthesis
MKKQKVCIIVPCYNEQENVKNVIGDICNHVPQGETWEIVVVNDCSVDSSPAVVREDGRATLLDLPFNLGIGGAVQTGLKYAVENSFDYAVKFDGDGQHLAQNITKLLSEIKLNDTDMVIGSRFCIEHDGFKSTFTRVLGIKFFQFLVKLLTGKTITDNTSGLRAYSRRALKFAAKHYPAFDYPEPEEVILMLKNNFIVKEIPCEMQPRQGGESCISFHKSIYYMLKVSFAILTAALRTPEKGYDK